MSLSYAQSQRTLHCGTKKSKKLCFLNCLENCLIIGFIQTAYSRLTR